MALCCKPPVNSDIAEKPIITLLKIRNEIPSKTTMKKSNNNNKTL